MAKLYFSQHLRQCDNFALFVLSDRDDMIAMHSMICYFGIESTRTVVLTISTFHNHVSAHSDYL